MMKSVRNLTTKVAAGIFGVLMLIFVLQLSGIFDTSTAGPLSTTSVGKINGQAIDARAYQARAADIDPEQTPAGWASSRPSRSNRSGTVRGPCRDGVAAQEVRDHGRQTRSSAMRTSHSGLVRSQEFQTDGQFDLAKYSRWLASPAAALI
jgi:hypothetical protein